MPEHPRNHPHHHSAVQRAEHVGRDGGEVEPYPFIYSKDPMDERRFLHPGEPYGPAFTHGPPTWVLWVLGVVVAVVIGGGLIASVVQAVTK